jgi:diguanylate cyclase (GGDEF)-like protein/PAS domain S-box-containing protein
VIATLAAMLIVKLREHAFMMADHEQRRLAAILADQAERSLQAVELVETTLLDRPRNDGAWLPESFREYMSGAAIHDELRSRGGALPQLDSITVTDDRGDLINTSREQPGPAINVGDRDFFQALTSDPALTMFVSAPMANRTNGKITVFIARKASGPDGRFLGLILASLNLPYLEGLYQTVSLGPETAIALRRLDGTVLARYPHVEPGGPHLDGPPVTSISGTIFRQVSPVDGRDRLIAEVPLAHFPVVVGVTNTIDAILADWREQATYLAGAAIVLEVMVVGFVLLTARRMRGARQLHEARAARAEAEAARTSAEAELAVARVRARADQELQAQNVLFAAALSNMSQALFMFDQTDRVIVVNDRVTQIFGLPAGSVQTGMTIEEIFGLLVEHSNVSPADVRKMRDNTPRLKQAATRRYYPRELSDGRTLAVNFAPMENGSWLLTLEDITERCEAEAKIAHMAHHDALTELPNRVLFQTRLREATARGRRDEKSAVLYLDLDHFKDVNDTLGHPIGDALLCAVTKLLRQEVRETDTIARLGGDEFAIVQSGVNQPHAARALAERLIEALHAPLEVAGHQVLIGTSIGIAIVPTDGDDADEVMKNADLALYSAKADGRSRYRFFAPGMDALMQARRRLELDLRKAVTERELELFYQPLMNIKTGSITGFEALVRWHHPERGEIIPSDFIPLAEETGLIVPLGQWALRRACLDAADWPSDIKVAVNVSVIQFESGTLVHDVAAALRSSGLDPSRLELEITESVMLNDTEATLVILYRLRDLGVGISMDDFGTGYSSLSYLRRFPFSKVKIDRSFVADLGRDGGSDAIVVAVTELCESLGMATLAEGVETEEQLRHLRAGNCGEAQGYLFSPARPASEVAEMCRRLGQPELQVAE